jgi:hypothetical protein
VQLRVNETALALSGAERFSITTRERSRPEPASQAAHRCRQHIGSTLR